MDGGDRAAPGPVPTDAEQSRAIVRYLGAGTSPFPRQDADAVRVAFGPEVLAVVQARVAETHALPTDWEREALPEATRRVAQELAARHPELDAAAIDALAWAFSYAWR